MDYLRPDTSWSDTLKIELINQDGNFKEWIGRPEGMCTQNYRPGISAVLNKDTILWIFGSLRNWPVISFLVTLIN